MADRDRAPDRADIMRAGALWGFAQLVQSLDGDPDALLAQVGLSSRDLEDFDRYIPRPAVIALYERAAEQLGCPDFGMSLAEMQDVNIVGALAFAVRNAADLRDAIETGSRYLHFHASAPTMAFEDDEGDRRKLVCRFNLGPEVAAASQYVEHAITLLVRIMRTLTSGRARPKQLLFAHGRIALPSSYRDHLGLVPDFHADVDGVVLTTRDLRAPLKDANRRLQSIAERYLDDHSPQPDRYAEQQLRQALSLLMRSGPAVTMADAAEALRVHPRTLQRRLKARGATFEQVRDEVRRDLAELYLAHDVIPIAHVADLLGYADQSVLTRSCMRWFGRTPLQMRQELAGRAKGRRSPI